MKKKVLVLGLGVSGQSAANYLLDKTYTVYGFDDQIKKIDLSKLQKKGLRYFKDIDLSTLDLIILSPGVPLHHFILLEAKRLSIEVIGEIELGCRNISNTAIGITGTNGKTTVTALISHVLNFCNKKAIALGNIGRPLTSMIDQLKDEILVLELSSYQIESMSSICLDIGVILNISPDHLDRYKSYQEYALTKVDLQRHIKKRGKLFVQEEAFSSFKESFKFENIIKTSIFTQKVDEINAFFALKICQEFDINQQDFFAALKSFKKPLHRLELVASVGGVSFYNDSKATNLDSVIKAVQSLENNIIIILGGLDKGLDYKKWIKPFHKRVKKIFVIGKAKEKIKEALGKHFSITCNNDLEDAVCEAFKIANRGDKITLSPGCSSFDMFENYEKRGEIYKNIVKNLSSCI